MATRGRKPKPVELKILRGDRKDRIPAAAPNVVAGLPACPDHLDDVARTKWAELVDQLSALGVLSATDAESLALYCSTFSQWRTARAALKDASTFTVLGGQGGIKLNPLVTVVNTSAALLARLQAEFGLTPSSRGRLKSSAPAPKDELEEFVTASRRKAK